MENKKKVLVIDDSAFMRRVISDIINNDNRCITVGTAVNGKDGLEKAFELKPDVITLDIQMPIMDGLTMLKKLNETNPIPVVMMSTLTVDGAKETIEALELGAVDFVAKPSNIFKVNSEEIKNELMDKIIMASNSKTTTLKKFYPSMTAQVKTTPTVYEDRTSKTFQNITGTKASNLIAIGTSTGGPKALQYVLPYLRKDIRAGIVIVQHMPPGFTKSLSERLNQLSEINVKEAENNEEILNGTAYIAPGDKHLVVTEVGGKLKISLLDDPPKGGHKPAVDVMMESIVNLKNIKGLVGVIMTGMGADGAEGLEKLKKSREIHIIAQNKESCVVYGMPKSVVERKIADEIVPLDKISDSITKKLEVLR